MELAQVQTRHHMHRQFSVVPVAWSALIVRHYIGVIQQSPCTNSSSLSKLLLPCIEDNATCGGNLNQVFSKNTKKKHTAHTIVSWPNPKQWVIVHTSDLMMIIRQSTYILAIITRKMGKLKTQSPTYCIMDNWENVLYLTHTLDKIYLTGIL